MTRMLQIRKGAGVAPIRVVLYGPPGVGKTGWGADAPAPIFLPVEDGLDGYPEAMTFPRPLGYEDVLDAVALLSRGAQELAWVKTLVIDTIDALDAMIQLKVRVDARGNGKVLPSLEEIGGGYGKGASRCLEIWQDLTARLDQLQLKRGINVVMLAHASTEKVRQPNGEEIPRHSLKLPPKASAHLKEWTRDLLFATLEVRKRGKWVKQSLTAPKRLVFTQAADSGAFDAKNRVGLPPVLPLSFGAYFEARNAGLHALGARGDQVDQDLLAEVESAMANLPEHMRSGKGGPFVKVAAAAGNGALRKLLNWAITKADELAGDAESVMASGARPSPKVDEHETEQAEAEEAEQEEPAGNVEPAADATPPPSEPQPSAPPASSPASPVASAGQPAARSPASTSASPTQPTAAQPAAQTGIKKPARKPAQAPATS